MILAVKYEHNIGMHTYKKAILWYPVNSFCMYKRHALYTFPNLLTSEEKKNTAKFSLKLIV